MKKSILSPEIIFHLIAIILAVFFIYKGLNKHWMSPCKIYTPDSTVPRDYISVITIFCQSGFFKMIGFFQIFSGILLIFPRTRFAGILILMPIVINMFAIHLFLDNRPEELIETGIPLLLALILALRYFKRIF